LGISSFFSLFQGIPHQVRDDDLWGI